MRRSLLLLSLLPAFLAGCTTTPSYADVQATAVMAGCWPSQTLPQPAPVTITPQGGPTPVGQQPLPGQPTTTVLPTTTTRPRCTPQPGEAVVLSRTPHPTLPPFPTRPPENWQEANAARTVMQMPARIYGLDLAVHPTAGWPVVGVMQRFGETNEPIQSFVRVLNPHSRTWGPLQQVDIGEASQGLDRNGSIAVGVTGDNTVHAAWGNSDTEGGLWASSSADYGTSWSAPRRLVESCDRVEDMVTSADGWIVVLATCYRRTSSGVVFITTTIARHPDGTWEQPQAIAGVPISFGAVVLVGEGAETTAVALATTHGSAGDPRTVHILKRRLADRVWDVQAIHISEMSDLAWRVRGLAFDRRGPDGSTEAGVIFTWNDRHTPNTYALISLDGGKSWSAPEQPAHSAGSGDPYITPAYDVAADRLVVFWIQGEDQGESTHYASWSAPGSDIWQPDPVSGARVPLISGATSAGDTVSAQASSSRSTWLAWLEGDHEIQVRAFTLDQILPYDQYPTPTPRPTATVEVQP